MPDYGESVRDEEFLESHYCIRHLLHRHLPQTTSILMGAYDFYFYLRI